MSNTPREHRARKRFGQNFLHDNRVIEKIAAAINASADDHLVEIGPGKGALTEYLLKSGARLDAVELDRDLLRILELEFADSAQLTLHSADALKFDFSALAAGNGNLRIVGNLPYNISTPLLFRLFELCPMIKDMHFMLQLEVVQRLASEPGSKRWGRLGVMAQYHCRVDALFEVPPAAFSPPPRVQSAVVRLTPRAQTPSPVDTQSLSRVVQAAFSQRRKTLRNSLRELADATVLEAAGINPGARAETLTLDDFVQITRRIMSETA